MKGKSRSLPRGVAVSDRDFENLLRRAAQALALRTPRRLSKVVRKKPATAA